MEHVSQHALGMPQFSSLFHDSILVRFGGSWIGGLSVTAEYVWAKGPEYDSPGSSRRSEDFKFMCSSPVGANQISFVSITMEVFKRGGLQKVLILITSIALCVFYGLILKVKES